MLHCYIHNSIFLNSRKHDNYFCLQTLVILVGVVDDKMLTHFKKSSRGNLKTSLFLLPILCQACHGKFYIGKLKEETDLVTPPELLQQEDPNISVSQPQTLQSLYSQLNSDPHQRSGRHHRPTSGFVEKTSVMPFSIGRTARVR